MNPEGGPTPEQMGVQPEGPPPPTPPQEPEEPAPTPPRVPPRRRGFWGRIWRRRPEEPEGLEENVRAVSEEQQQAVSDEEQVARAERMVEPQTIEIPNTPEELAEFLARMDPFAARERRLQERYGRGILGNIRT